jgi:hypothetical protein
VRSATGFTYDEPSTVPPTEEPSGEELRLLRGPVAEAIGRDYPEFSRRVWGPEGVKG